MKGRPLRGALSGFFFGLFLSLLLLTIGAVALDSILLIVFPIAFLLLGIVLAAAAPFKRDRLERPVAPAAPPPGATPPGGRLVADAPPPPGTEPTP